MDINTSNNHIKYYLILKYFYEGKDVNSYRLNLTIKGNRGSEIVI